MTINIGLNPKTTTSLLLVIAIAIVAIVGALAISLSGRSQSQPAPAADVVLDVDAVPSMTGNFYFTSTFEADDQSREYWLTFENSGWTFAFTDDGRYELTNRIANTAATSIVIGGTGYENISLEMDAALSMDSAPASAYGIIFNYQDDDNYNVFAVDGLGRYSIWRRENAVWIELRDRDEAWTANDAIRPKGETNMLLVSVINNTFTAYVNDRRVARVNDPTFASGGIGIYYASDSDAATVSIDRFRVYSSVPSMTGQG